MPLGLKAAAAQRSGQRLSVQGSTDSSDSAKVALERPLQETGASPGPPVYS